MPLTEEITKMVISSLIDINEELGQIEFQEPTSETRLYGAKSNLDSLSLVRLIVDVEEKLSKRFGKNIVLADERAMSQVRSPFRRVSSFVEYIETLLREQGIS